MMLRFFLFLFFSQLTSTAQPTPESTAQFSATATPNQVDDARENEVGGGESKTKEISMRNIGVKVLITNGII